jgi:hypothetical protein
MKLGLPSGGHDRHPRGECTNLWSSTGSSSSNSVTSSSSRLTKANAGGRGVGHREGSQRSENCVAHPWALGPPNRPRMAKQLESTTTRSAHGWTVKSERAQDTPPPQAATTMTHNHALCACTKQLTHREQRCAHCQLQGLWRGQDKSQLESELSLRIYVTQLSLRIRAATTASEPHPHLPQSIVTTASKF